MAGIWEGLTPSERSSDVHTRRGHISKQGSQWLRWVMVEVAARPAHDPYRQPLEAIASQRQVASPQLVIGNLLPRRRIDPALPCVDDVVAVGLVAARYDDRIGTLIFRA